MDKKAELKRIIKAFEDGKTSIQLTLSRVHELTGKEIIETEIRGYRTYTSLEEFCNELLTEPIADWKGIDEARALLLIREMVADVTNSPILNRNSEALAKRYGKTPGFISDLIFHSDITDELTILERLKKDTTIYL